ncbi:MAG: S8 family serine peptidase [Gemmatimonadetes bacterium]|nr:S8 family serine peptidase [Gemmatimonadota bacterium]
MADTLCVRAQFTITGPTSVTTNFPTAAECPSGLLLTRSQPATWVQTPNRRLRLFVRFRNLTGQAVQLPVRLYLPATGTTVVLPAGTPPSKVVAYQPDSSEAGGGRVWFVGGSSVLAAGDSTAEDTLTFQVQSPVTKARWQFQATVEVNDTTTPVLPSTWVPLEDSSFTAPVSSAREALVYRKLVSVEFLPTTTGTIIRAFMTKYGAVVAGGFPWGPRGSYVFEVPDPGSSLAAVDSLLALMRSEPGVADAGRLYYRDVLQPRGRYPVDGASGRAAWADTATATVAWRAVRAPLAWGCENGQYGATAVPVAMLDVTLDALHDLPAIRRAGTSVPVRQDALLVGAGTSAKIMRSHGMALAGIVTAIGNNGQGIAGLLWQSTAVFYPYGRNDSTISNRPDWLLKAVQPDLLATGAHILVTSSADGEAADSSRVAKYRAFLEPWLQQDSKNLLVYPMDEGPLGQSGIVTSLASVAATVIPGLKATDRAVAQLALLYPDQILLVGGSRPGSRTFWPQSGYWSGPGGTAILAPAENVLTLAHSADFGSDSRLADGTSYAAPMVAGVAAQLMAMDSTLTAAQVKDYILRGAQEPLLDSVTGQPVPRLPVPGAPGTIYQLDAYGSLSLLSKERMGTPVCGIPVSVTQQNPSYIRLERTPTAIESFPVAALSGAQNPSVAQGGRVISVTDGDKYGTTGVDRITATLQNGAWGERARTPWDGATFERWYLEEDTALVQLVPGPPNTFFTDRFVLRLRHPDGSTTGPINMCEADPPGAWQYLVECAWSISPSSADYATDVLWQISHVPAQVLQRFSLVSTSPGSPTRMLELPWSTNYGIHGPAAWTPDGRRFLQVLSTSPFIPAAGTVLNYEYGTAWTPRAIAVPPGGAAFGTMSFIEGGAGVRSTEITGGSCVTTVRGAHALALGSTLGGCDTIGRVFPNLAGPLAARGAPAASTRVRTGAPSRRVVAN